MRTNVQKTAQLGELVAAAFDSAAQYSNDPREVSRLAAGAVMRMMRRSRMRKLGARRLDSAAGMGNAERP